MRAILLYFGLLIVAGCASFQGQSITSGPDVEQAYDARDEIANDAQKTLSNQYPLVGIKKVVVVAVEWPGEKKLDPVLLNRQVFSSDHDSLRSYILAASNGKLDLAGDVITHVSDSPRPEVCSKTTYPFDLAVSEGNKALQAKGIDPAKYDFQFNILDCGGMGSAQLGGRNLSIYGQVLGTYIYWHEFGHILGYSHGYTYTRCQKSGETVTAPSGCTLSDYGDTGNPVGGGSFLPSARARFYSGWLDNEQAVLIEQTGLYRLGVMGKTGPQAYFLKRDSGAEPALISMEYRKPSDYDIFSETDNRANGVWIRFSNSVGALVEKQVDGTPETTSTLDPTFLPGRTFVDEVSKIKIHVCRVYPTGANLSIAVNGDQLPSCSSEPVETTIKMPEANSRTTLFPVLTGSAEPGISLRINDGSSEWQTVSDVEGHWTFIPDKALPPGNRTFTVSRILEDSSQAASATLTIVLADLPLPPPILKTPLKNVLSGKYSLFSGTGTPGAIVNVVKDGYPTVVYTTTTVDAFGKWQALNKIALPPGTYTAGANQSMGGKKSGWAAPITFQVSELVALPVFEKPDNGNTVYSTTVFSGSGTPGERVFVVQDGVLAEGLVDAYGKWRAKSNKKLTAGPYLVGVTNLINGQFFGCVNTRTGTVTDTPMPPTIKTPLKDMPTGQRPRLSGEGIPDAVVRILGRKTEQGQPIIGGAIVDRFGHWQADSSNALPFGPYPIEAEQTIDKKVSSLSDTRDFIVVETPPPPVIKTPENNSTVDNHPVFEGSGVPGAIVAVVQNVTEELLAQATVDPSGQWETRSQLTLPPGNYEVGAYQTMADKRSGWATVKKFIVK